MKRIIVCAALAATLVAAAPASANAAWLTKPRAKAKATQVARGLYRGVDWADDYWVEASYECGRRSGLVVDCDYFLYDEAEDMTCTGTVRVRLLPYTNRTTFTFPYEVDCD